MTQDELLRLIDKAAAEKWTTLDLAGQGLDELPPEIGKLTNLKTLVLGRWDKKQGKSLGNNLKTLPSEIGQLVELRSLSYAASILTPPSSPPSRFLLSRGTVREGGEKTDPVTT